MTHMEHNLFYETGFWDYNGLRARRPVCISTGNSVYCGSGSPIWTLEHPRKRSDILQKQEAEQEGIKGLFGTLVDA